MTADKPARVHLPTAVARLGETEYPDAYGGLTVRPTGPGSRHRRRAAQLAMTLVT